SSSNSTPPTSQDDSASILSDAIKADASTDTQQAKLEQEQDQSARRTSRRSRSSVSTYNVQILAGTAIHTPTKYLEKHTKNVMRQEQAVSGNTFVNGSVDTKDRLLGEGAEKLDSEWVDETLTGQLGNETEGRLKRRKSSRVDLLKEVTRNAMASASSSLGKRGRGVLESGMDRLQALRKDTGSSRRRESESTIRVEPPAKRTRLSIASMPELHTEAEKAQDTARPKVNRWQTQGLYLGQHRDFDARFTESKNQNKGNSAAMGENKILPLPMFAGEKLLLLPYKEARDFKLPFDVFSPLPRKAKPEDWKKTSKNLFVGDSATIWKKSKPQAESYCLCTPEEGCGEGCQNRFMLYECDSTNCLINPEHCTNRAFAELKRRSKGNRYDYGVEVMETEGRGYGVRAMRTFNPHQIIVEYAGEIITQEECDRRMNNEYKNNKCYYLMTFHNKMIIDASRGSIARFVNHSCEPNCRMVKWTVAGEPRMALFAGDRGIMTGEELTYDYNFDPFSSKNVQECRCGTASCRGVLGPRSKDAPKAKAAATALVAGAKRKIRDVFGSKGSRAKAAGPNKRRKVAAIARSALAKAKKSVTESENSRDARAEGEAAETEARGAS
ncbi:SET domain-containing protein, partial [Cenococcum geophilum 1.58]|uniref:SET domain-containing protein n=1 Tax=Cenococcum geophilum 1.58 TaxID=794803 RepID=UPI00358FE32B